MRRSLLGLVAIPLLLAGCSTVSDVEASYQRDLGMAQEKLLQAQSVVDNLAREHQEDLASAREWDVHWLGIPAGGWVTIFVLVGIFAVAAVSAFTFLLMRAHRENRIRAHKLSMEREHTEQARLKREQAEFESVARYIPPKKSTEV